MIIQLLIYSLKKILSLNGKKARLEVGNKKKKKIKIKSFIVKFVKNSSQMKMSMWYKLNLFKNNSEFFYINFNIYILKSLINRIKLFKEYNI